LDKANFRQKTVKNGAKVSAGVTHEATGVSHEATGRAWQRGRALTSRTQMLGTKNSRNRFRFFIAS